MKSLYNNKIFKNYQINLGIPFQVKAPVVNFETIKKAEAFVSQELEEETLQEAGEISVELLQSAREEAELIIKEAHYEALRMIEKTEKEANESRLQIEAEARERGYMEGTEEAQRQYESLVKEAGMVLEQAKVEYRTVLESTEADAVNVILDIARKVIGNELCTNREHILFMVQQAYEKCANRDSILIRVSPQDYEYLDGSREQLLCMVEGIGELDLKKDSSLKPGACIVETPYGSVDAGMETRIRKIEEAFRQCIIQ
jgi:flagellar assembly protein FliH